MSTLDNRFSYALRFLYARWSTILRNVWRLCTLRKRREQITLAALVKVRASSESNISLFTALLAPIDARYCYVMKGFWLGGRRSVVQTCT